MNPTSSPFQNGSCLLRCFVLVITLALGSTAFAQSDPDRQSSDEVGAQAVKSLGKVPWYDSEEERVKAVKVESTDGAKADLPTRAAGYQGKTGTRPLGGGSFWAGVGEVLTWSILSVIVLLVVAGIAYALLRLERNRIARQVGEGDMESEQTESAERLQRLPVQVKQPASNLLAEAKLMMEAGRYNEAIVYLFSHQLVQLDRHQLLRLARGKTNRQYLGEIRQSHDLREILHSTIHAFEDAFFGKHTISRQRFQSCWDQLDRFHAALNSCVAKERSE